MHSRVPKRHNEYEMVYVLSPSTTPAGATKVTDIIRESVDGHEGKILKVDLWGVRKLAYRIKGHKQGIYHYIRFLGTQPVVMEMERRLRINEAVLRFLTVKLSKRPVDPASYTVDEEESAFKPIDEILANLQTVEEEPSGKQEGEEGEKDARAVDQEARGKSEGEDKPEVEKVPKAPAEEDKPKDKPKVEKVPKAPAEEDKPKDKPEVEKAPEEADGDDAPEVEVAKKDSSETSEAGADETDKKD